jgi:hypothetical protein
MRRLTDAVKVDPNSLYIHVDGKEAVLDALAESLRNEVQVTGGELGWKESSSDPRRLAQT